MFNSKRGISPLVATVLLVCFAVALGGVVMSWGQDLVEEGAAGKASCFDIKLKLHELGGERKLCFGGTGASGYVDFVIDNDSPFNVNALAVWMFGQQFGSSSMVQVTDLPESEIKAGAPYVGRATYDFLRFGTLNRVIFVPKVVTEGEFVYCYDNSLIADSLLRC